MNSDLSAIDWNQMRGFLATVEAGSLSAGARRLGLTQPTLGRQVAALEEALGVTLFERLGRTLVLTQAGHELAGHAREMGRAAERLTLAAAGQSQDISGTVRITAADIYAAYVLPNMLLRLKAEAPQLRVEVLAVNTISDLMRREADIAIRHVRPEQDGLYARRCADTVAHFYGTPDYISKLGPLEGPHSLVDGEIVGALDRQEDFVAELRQRGVPVGPANFRWSTENGVVGWEWVRRGLCLGAMLEPVALASPEVVRALPDMAPIPVPVWLVTHRELHTSRRIRLVFDLLAEMLNDEA